MNRRTPIYLNYAFLVILALFLASCTMRPAKQMPGMGIITSPTDIPITSAARMDAYHKVAPGETLWRISQMYDVEVNTIQKVNKITDVTDIKIGQKLFIPDAAPRAEVITLYPSNKWKYIIIHHSATDKGNCQIIDRAHKQRGWKCVGYHFVIDNGTSGKEDGQIDG